MHLLVELARASLCMQFAWWSKRRCGWYGRVVAMPKLGAGLCVMLGAVVFHRDSAYSRRSYPLLAS